MHLDAALKPPPKRTLCSSRTCSSPSPPQGSCAPPAGQDSGELAQCHANSVCWFKGPSLNRPEITSGNENKGAGAPPEGESQTPYPCRPCWGHLEVKCVLSRRRLRARRQRRGSRHTVFSAGILQGACGIIPRGLQIGSGRQVIPLFSSSRLGPLSPGWLWPLGPKSGSPQRAPPTPETAPGSRGPPPAPARDSAGASPLCNGAMRWRKH